MYMKLSPTTSLISPLCFRVDIHEIKAHTQFDIDSNGEVSDEEAKVRFYDEMNELINQSIDWMND